MSPGAKPVLSPVCSSEIESWLKQRGARFLRCIEVPLANFDDRASRANQARPTALVPETVERYTVAMRAKATFPPVVAYRTAASSQRFVLIDGNNRIAAARKAGWSTFPTYVLVEPSTELIALLTVEANRAHGEPVPTEWRVRQAVNLVSLGYRLEQACEAANVTAQTVRNYRGANVADTRARQLRVAGFSSLPMQHKYVLGALKYDEVFHQAAAVAVGTSMTTAECAAFVREIKAQRSEVDQLRVIGETMDHRKAILASEKAIGRTAHKVSSAKMALVSAVGKIMHVQSLDLLRQVTTDLERMELKSRIDDCLEHLIDLGAALEQLIADRQVSNG